MRIAVIEMGQGVTHVMHLLLFANLHPLLCAVLCCVAA